ncbi:hypothetical protein AUK11_03720 [bacterium CG2_30_37_16]|nr:MAG: hypothetical protein AUK11_03720 [bacterium CG2_30_37_16]PIP31125.1 MAG: hypothetical protein COX25_01010 [bacterium (Candidatus Howlettbacteria) CG23_combo_of_CG06-09_8_20_14_all_37_9]PIY00242.1 MAG: hypothetical protein COZ22_00690 [bacterium (Candidatus Howlettbacteria) CG_4_10_14_3_um_filter_37_10]PJB06056.1 MAG: hypothetical protein CO123_02850 [bacterium (Candidatus Howlettbacteria) CG_4_9_14_3_um_filter_37_10]
MDPNKNSQEILGKPSETVTNGSENTLDNILENKKVEAVSTEDRAQNIAVEQPAPVIQNQVQSQTAPAIANDANIQDQAIIGTPIDSPYEASHTEEIEKPWIEKVEQIIKKDKNDPYQEEDDHEELQMSYLEKRFGKKVQKDN